MKFKLDFGTELDLLTKGELDESLGKATEFWRAYARGIKPMDLPVLQGAVSSGGITLGSLSDGSPVECGPRQGFYWRVTRVSVSGLASGDTVSLYKADPTAGRFVTTITAAAGSVYETSRGLLLRSGQHISVTGTGLTGTFLVVSGEAVEVPAEMIGKLLGG